MTLVFSGKEQERCAEIRQSSDGYSVFTWSDFGSTTGVMQWRERHAQEYGPAFASACAWLRKAEMTPATVSTIRGIINNEKAH